jgi:hypothetical protein
MAAAVARTAGSPDDIDGGQHGLGMAQQQCSNPLALAVVSLENERFFRRDQANPKAFSHHPNQPPSKTEVSALRQVLRSTGWSEWPTPKPHHRHSVRYPVIPRCQSAHKAVL